jgi:hypothetical protein
MSVKNVFDWRGPSVFSLDAKMRQAAYGAKAGQIAIQRTLHEKKQIVIYSKGRQSAKTEK